MCFTIVMNNVIADLTTFSYHADEQVHKKLTIQPIMDT